MPESFYDPGERRAAKVEALFTRIASRYDLINDLQSFGLHRYWKRRVVQLAAPSAGKRALDVCCGTGDLALALARRGAEVIGLDFNAQMLAIARAKNSPKSKVQSLKPGVGNPESTVHRPQSMPEGAHSPEFIQGDAQQLPFPDNVFDIVTVGYGLRNLASYETGLREMQRVARPGGRILVLDFGKPDNPLWRWLYFRYLRLFVPCLGRVFCGSADAYAYILESLHHYPAQHGVAAKTRELGLTNVRIVYFLGGVMTINYAEKR